MIAARGKKRARRINEFKGSEEIAVEELNVETFDVPG